MPFTQGPERTASFSTSASLSLLASEPRPSRGLRRGRTADVEGHDGCRWGAV